jgi:hypothetical protein
LGEVYPWTLYPVPAFEMDFSPSRMAVGDVNGDDRLDILSGYYMFSVQLNRGYNR